jgi:hypothetical protein
MQSQKDWYGHLEETKELLKKLVSAKKGIVGEVSNIVKDIQLEMDKLDLFYLFIFSIVLLYFIFFFFFIIFYLFFIFYYILFVFLFDLFVFEESSLEKDTSTRTVKKFWKDTNRCLRSLDKFILLHSSVCAFCFCFICLLD